jgi:hypothetical protein
MRPGKRSIITLITVILAMLALAAMGWVLAGCDNSDDQAAATTTSSVVTATTTAGKTLSAGETWEVAETTSLRSLTVGEGTIIAAPEGKCVTLTVDGVETGQVLASTDGYDLVFVPATYTGDVVLTVADANPVEYSPAGPAPTPVVSPFRQAIYVDATGFVPAKSVIAAIIGGRPAADMVEGLKITSTGECFNGIYAASSYTVKDVEIDFTGNARSDFSGYGTAVVGTGEGTTLVVDGAQIRTDGVARAAVVATNGANVIVKNSDIQTKNGELPADYLPTIDTAKMRSAPWMLGLSGNVRATNILGTNTKASYINSSITSEGWGVLSTDGCTTPTLTAINSTISITGEDGYGSYGTGDATENFLGCAFDVASYATISRGSFLFYGDSTPEKVAQLNTDLSLGLTEEEMAAVPNLPTVVNSKRFGIMWHGGGTLEVSGGTVFNTKETTFLDKGQAIKIAVDGAEGAQLNPENGVIMQFMDDDDPGSDLATMLNTGVYNEPTTPAELDATHDLTRAADADAQATFANITLAGDFYNSTRGGLAAPMVPPPGAPPATDAGAAPAADPAAAGTTTTAAGTATTAAGAAPPATAGDTATLTSNSKNLCLTFDNSKITGIISASTATHAKASITEADYKLLGTVTNTPGPAVNNGVVVVLKNKATWMVTGDAYLTSLTIGADCSVAAEGSMTLIMTVDGVDTPLAPGTYKGKIVLSVKLPA